MARAAIEGQLRAAGDLYDLDRPLLHAARHASAAVSARLADVESDEDGASGHGEAADDTTHDGTDVRLGNLVSGVGVPSVVPALSFVAGTGCADSRV